MELRHLRYFYAVALEMNFTKAAESLHIAQPPLSRQIMDLEEELGVKLFIRRPHFLALTPEGELLKQYAAQILDLADKAAENVLADCGKTLPDICVGIADDGETQAAQVRVALLVVRLPFRLIVPGAVQLNDHPNRGNIKNAI